MQAFRTTFPDVDGIDYNWIIEDKTVVIRDMRQGTHEGERIGIEPAGREVELSEMEFNRFKDEKVRKDWTLHDALGLCHNQLARELLHSLLLIREHYPQCLVPRTDASVASRARTLLDRSRAAEGERRRPQ